MPQWVCGPGDECLKVEGVRGRHRSSRVSVPCLKYAVLLQEMVHFLLTEFGSLWGILGGRGTLEGNHCGTLCFLRSLNTKKG